MSQEATASSTSILACSAANSSCSNVHIYASKSPVAASLALSLAMTLDLCCPWAALRIPPFYAPTPPTGLYYPQLQEQPIMVDPHAKRQVSGLRRVCN